MKTLNWSADGNQGRFAFQGKIILNYQPAFTSKLPLKHHRCLIAKDAVDKHEPHNQKAGA